MTTHASDDEKNATSKLEEAVADGAYGIPPTFASVGAEDEKLVV